MLPWLAHIIALVSAGVGIAAGVRCGGSIGTRCHCGSGSGSSSGSSGGGYDACIESLFVWRAHGLWLRMITTSL